MTRLKSIPAEMDHSVPVEDRKLTNETYFELFITLQVFWNLLFIWASFFSDQSKTQGDLLHDITIALLFLVLSVLDVIKRRCLTLLAPIIVAATFMYVYLHVVKRVTHFFTLATFTSFALASMHIISTMDNFSAASFEKDENLWGLTVPFILIIIIACYCSITLICFLKDQSDIIELYKEALSAFFHCIITVLIGIATFIIIFVEIVKVTSLDFLLWGDRSLPRNAIYFLRGFNWFTSICLMNFAYNTSQICIVQIFAHWYKTKDTPDAPKYEIIKSLKIGFKMLVYQSGTVVCESLPLVSTIHAFISMSDGNSRTSKNWNNCIVRFIWKCRMVLGINGFINVYTSIYGYDFQESVRKSTKILFEDVTKYHGAIDIFCMTRLWGISAILYFFAIPVSQDILFSKGYFLVGKDENAEEINQWLMFLLALVISSIALIMYFVVGTIHNVILLRSLGGLRNNCAICKKRKLNDLSPA